ncbi:hypothetical protein V6N13_148889 [Hibiscus sabdariffa]
MISWQQPNGAELVSSKTPTRGCLMIIVCYTILLFVVVIFLHLTLQSQSGHLILSVNRARKKKVLAFLIA